MQDDLDSPDAFEGSDAASPDVTPADDARREFLLTRPQLAKLLRMDVKTVDRMIRQGAPIAGRAQTNNQHSGTAPLFDPADFVRWWIEREKETVAKKVTVVGEGDEAFTEEKVRDKAAQATLREISVERELKRLVPIADVHTHIDECSGLVRNAINALHTQVRDLTDDQRDDLVKACDAALDHIHTYVPQESDVSTMDFGDGDDEPSFG